MAGKKTRFVIEMKDGSERDVFSVKENPNGGLTILMPKFQPSEHSTVYDIEHRFSVHESLNTHDGGFEVKETIERSDGTTIHNFAYARPNTNTTMLHIFGQLPAHQNSLPDKSGRPSKGRVVITRGFWRGALFYIVIASKTPFDPNWLNILGLHVVEAKFQRYSLIVASGIFHALAASGGALTANTMSKPSRINGGYQRWARHLDAPQFPVTPSPEHLPFEVGHLIDFLAEAGKAHVGLSRWDNTGAPPTPEDIYKYWNYDRYSSDASESHTIERLPARALRQYLHSKDLWNPSTRGPAVHQILPPADTEQGP